MLPVPSSKLDKNKEKSPELETAICQKCPFKIGKLQRRKNAYSKQELYFYLGPCSCYLGMLVEDKLADIFFLAPIPYT